MTEMKLIDVSTLKKGSEISKTSTCLAPRKDAQIKSKTPTTITFVRKRIFYARAALNAKGRVTFGLRHIRESTSVKVFPILTFFRCLESIL